MAMSLGEINDGVYYAQYIGCDPAMQFYRERGNNELVRVQVIKREDGALLLMMPHVNSPSMLNAVPLEAALAEWRFVRRVRMSTRLAPVPARASSSGRNTLSTASRTPLPPPSPPSPTDLAP